MSHILAIDGGGTKTHVLLCTEKGEVIAEGDAEGTNPWAVSPEQAVSNMQAALNKIDAVHAEEAKQAQIFLGLAGVDTPEDEQQARKIFAALFETMQPASVTIVGDVEIALASGSVASNAICLIGGTGSNCWGYNAQGQKAKTSGIGYLLADQGSGYQMGLAALQTGTKSFDGRIPHSQLQEMVLEHFQVSDYWALNNKVYNPLLTKPEIAALAHQVRLAAEAGDHAAQTIVAQTIGEWLEMVRAVLVRLGLEATPTDLVLVGGLTKDASLFDKFALDMKDHYPQVNIIRPEKPPVYGALALALKQTSQA